MFDILKQIPIIGYTILFWLYYYYTILSILHCKIVFVRLLVIICKIYVEKVKTFICT